MDFFENIYNAATGELTTRPYTADEIAAVEAEAALAIEAARVRMTLSFAQLLIGLVAEGWITEAEGEAWLVGTLPAPVLALISTLPANERFAAKARATRPSEVLRADPLLANMAAAAGKDAAQLDNFFITYGAV